MAEIIPALPPETAEALLTKRALRMQLRSCFFKLDRATGEITVEDGAGDVHPVYSPDLGDVYPYGEYSRQEA